MRDRLGPLLDSIAQQQHMPHGVRGGVALEHAIDKLNAVKLEPSLGGKLLSPEMLPFSPNTSSLLSGSLAEDHEEAVMRQCFADAYQREVEYLSSLNVDVTKDRKRQILADILVWAEITQQHYEQEARSFVMEPHQHDESFLRVGRFLKEAKSGRGLL